MTCVLLEDWVADPALPVFRPERRDAAMSYFALRCACGGEQFRVAGWPRLAAGRGGYFWRTIARVWREARQPMQAGEPVESPFLLPLVLQCDRCDGSAMLFDAPGVDRSLAEADRSLPRESHRCGACRRGLFDLVAGVILDADEAASALEIFARCHACHRQARVAWADSRPSAQQIRLDLLYGRR